ncbi:hypothetical protein BDR26DRAFT_1010551 [Obelidium mucronatum]|nr:hypothetical protein BDR26DRAFT_1010551 [Obelidium mucronatum]
MDSPAVRRTSAATADVDNLQKEEQAIAISMAMWKKNKLVIDRQEVSQNPNRSASALVDAMMKQLAVVHIDKREGMAAAFKIVLLSVYTSTVDFGTELSLVAAAQAKTDVQWEEYLVKQYDEAFPPPKLLEDTSGKPAKKQHRKSVSGPGPKQVVKNTIQLVKKIEAILKLSAFKDIAEAWESIKLEPSVGLKCNAILTQCTRQFNDICAGLYVGRYNVKKPSAIGTLDQLATFLRGVRKATRGHALSPLLTPQEVQKLNSQLQHDAAKDDEVLEDDSDKGDEASDLHGMYMPFRKQHQGISMVPHLVQYPPEATAPPRQPLLPWTRIQQIPSSSRKALSKRNVHAKKSAAELDEIRKKEVIRMRALQAARSSEMASATRAQDAAQHRFLYNARLMEEHLKQVYSEEELADMDASLPFGLKSTQEEIYTKCADQLSLNAMTKHCCVVCDCNYAKSELVYWSAAAENMYNISGFDVKLANLFLSPNSFYYKSNELYHPVRVAASELQFEQLPGQFVYIPREKLLVAICPDCFEGTRRRSADSSDSEREEATFQRMPPEAILAGSSSFGDISRTT